MYNLFGYSDTCIWIICVHYIQLVISVHSECNYRIYMKLLIPHISKEDSYLWWQCSVHTTLRTLHASNKFMGADVTLATWLLRAFVLRCPKGWELNYKRAAKSLAQQFIVLRHKEKEEKANLANEVVQWSDNTRDFPKRAPSPTE